MNQCNQNCDQGRRCVCGRYEGPSSDMTHLLPWPTNTWLQRWLDFWAPGWHGRSQPPASNNVVQMPQRRPGKAPPSRQ